MIKNWEYHSISKAWGDARSVSEVGGGGRG